MPRSRCSPSVPTIRARHKVVTTKSATALAESRCVATRSRRRAVELTVGTVRHARGDGEERIGSLGGASEESASAQRIGVHLQTPSGSGAAAAVGGRKG